ncbi:unnamed protein product, partial [Musa textilis]
SRKPSESPLLPASAAKPSSDVEGFDPRNIERAIRLHSDITNRRSKKFTELIGDEWRHCFSRLPVHPLELTLQMLHSIMVRNSIMFVKKPTAGYGVDIGFRCPGLSDLAKDNLPLSFGCTIAAAQVCGHITSKVLIDRCINVICLSIVASNLFMGSELKLEVTLLHIIDKLAPKTVLEGKERAVLHYSLLSLLTTVISAFIFK